MGSGYHLCADLGESSYLEVVLDVFNRRCEEAGVRPSMAGVGDCLGNAMAESFFAIMECELLDRVTYRTRA